MSDSPKENLVTLLIDGKEVSVPAGTNVIDAAESLGIEVPHYCYHPKLSVVGNCRMCLVEMGMPMKDRATGEPVLDGDGKQKIGWMPKPVIGCATNVAPGMQIRTNSDLVKDCRNGVMEFLLINHPLDCPICDQAGECRLQEFATDYGRGYSRFVEQKVVKPKRTILGPRVMLDDERCILCSRCIRFSKEIANDDVLGFIDRGSYSTLTCYPGKQLENNYSLNTVDICPVGALTSRDFRFKMRVWFLSETPSICTESSVGANTLVGSREGKIYRITPRRNDAVNDTWMTDSGRALYKQVEAENRLSSGLLSGKETSPTVALEKALEILQKTDPGKIAIVGSGKATVEEQFLLQQLATSLGVEKRWLVSRVEEGDGMLLSADRNPNVRGAVLTGLIKDLPEKQLASLATAIEQGEVETVFTLGEDLSAAGISPELQKKVKVVGIFTHTGETTGLADVVIPGLTVFEKEGSFVNQQFRLQKFLKAVPGPTGVSPEVQSLAWLSSHLGHSLPGTVAGIWDHLSRDIPVFAGLSFSQLSPLGQRIDPGSVAYLPWAEGPGLHFEPASTAKSLDPAQ